MMSLAHYLTKIAHINLQINASKSKGMTLLSMSTFSKRSYFKSVIRNMATAKKAQENFSKIDPDLIKEWDGIHSNLLKQIIQHDTEAWQSSPDLSGLERVAGIDISTDAKDHDADECDAFAAVAICSFPDMNILHQETQKIRISVPYVPGYLAFRECDPIVDLITKITGEHPDKVPDVLLIDGNGFLHPHRCGMACHVGIHTSIPAIGVAKNLHLLKGIEVSKPILQGLESVGDYILIRDDSNEVLGMALKTASDTKNPMYISVGHKISLETAKNVVLKCCNYRVPDPIRFADNISRELIRKDVEKSQSNDNK